MTHNLPRHKPIHSAAEKEYFKIIADQVRRLRKETISNKPTKPTITAAIPKQKELKNES